MSEDSGQNRRKNTGKGSSSNYNFLLGSALGVVAAVFLVAYFVSQVTTERIGYSDLIRLIKNSKRVEGGVRLADGHSGTLEVNRQGRKVVYKNIQELELSPHAVSGKIDRQVFDAQGQPRAKERGVSFHTDKTDSEDATGQVRAALDASNIPFDYARRRAFGARTD